jgi:hypothetical protein
MTTTDAAARAPKRVYRLVEPAYDDLDAAADRARASAKKRAWLYQI